MNAMRCNSLVLAFLIGGIFFGISGTAQQRLGDIGDKIKLNKTEAGAVVISDSTLPSRTEAAPVVTYGDLLLRQTEVCQEATARFLAVFDDLLAGNGFFKADWRESMMDATYDLESAGMGLDRLKPPTDLAEAHRWVIGAAREYATVAEQVRTAIRTNIPAVEEVKGRIEAAEGFLAKAHEIVENSRKKKMDSEPAPLIDQFAAFATIENLCGRAWPDGGQNQDSCVTTQKAAVQNLLARNRYQLDIAG
jgi:hypothetical protein